MHCVYILLSFKDKDLYVGYTNDLKKRFAKHNAGKVQATSWRYPMKLVYYEAYLDEDEARERERYFKTGWGRRYVLTKLGKSLERAKS